MNVTKLELKSIVERIQTAHDDRLIALAMFNLVTAGLIDDHLKAHGQSSRAMRDLLNECITAYLEKNDINPSDLHAVQALIHRANTTVMMIESLPA